MHDPNHPLSIAQNGARLKAWAGPNVAYGRIRNITFKDFYIQNTDNPIVLDQCYFNVNASTCAAYPSHVNISDIFFENFRGSSSGKGGKVVAKLVCSPEAVCDDIRLENVELTSPAGSPPEIVCDGIEGGIGVPCVSSANA
jgi:galacturan 1,4-alpha-galacturonidase